MNSDMSSKMKKVCFPVQADQGLDSTVYGHFGSAPAFIVVDRDTGQARQVSNNDAHHEHGRCSPLKALGGEQVDCVVVGGIGAGALGKLMAMGVDVFRAEQGTVRDNLERLEQGALARFSPAFTCGGHGGGHGAGGCSHH